MQSAVLRSERCVGAARSLHSTGTALRDYYRCASPFGTFGVTGGLSPDEGYFTFRGATCYGRRHGGLHAPYATSSLQDVSHDVEYLAGETRLPFDLSEVVTNLRRERYRRKPQHYLEKIAAIDGSRRAYYFLRPMLRTGVRKHLQRLCLFGWERIAFPRWPVDASVDTLMRQALALELECRGTARVPFIWFWPDGAASGAIVTHDVESRAGLEFCGRLMDVDDSWGIKSAFQLVPEERYETSLALCDSFRSRGFEVNLHDLNHDGQLYRDRPGFLQRAAQINDYARRFESHGFRSGAMYRQQTWYSALDVSFDMSVPNVAHLEPERGGCCTVMPYFVGNILELPLTTIQDYSLFHILGNYSTTLWQQQIDLILAQNGLVSVLTHPDYLIDEQALAVYLGLLAGLRRLRDEGTVWLALPGEVDDWWRCRNQMVLVRSGDSWRIEGTESGRARVAYATLQRGDLVYEVDGRVMNRSF